MTAHSGVPQAGACTSHGAPRTLTLRRSSFLEHRRPNTHEAPSWSSICAESCFLAASAFASPLCSEETWEDAIENTTRSPISGKHCTIRYSCDWGGVHLLIHRVRAAGVDLLRSEMRGRKPAGCKWARWGGHHLPNRRFTSIRSICLGLEKPLQVGTVLT